MQNDPADDTTSAYIAACARVLGLSIEPEWLPQIKVALQATQRASDFVTAFELPDETEPAPVFEA